MRYRNSPTSTSSPRKRWKARAGFAVDLTPRGAEDPRTLTVPSDVPIPERLLQRTALLAR